MRSNLFELPDVVVKSFSACGARPHILLTLTDDSYDHSDDVARQLSISLSADVIRIPQYITEYTVDEYLAFRPNGILHLPFFAQRSKQLLSRLLRIVHSKDYTLIIGADRDDVNELTSIANSVDVIITDSNIPEDSIDERTIAYLLKRIASSNVDRNVELLRRSDATPAVIFSNVIFGQLFIRGIDPRVQETRTQDERVSSTQEHTASSPIEEGVYDELKVKLSKYTEKRKSAFKTSAYTGSKAGSIKQRFATHGRPNRTLVRNSRSGMFSLFHTLVAAAPHQVSRRVNTLDSSLAYLLEKEDIRRYQYELTPAHLEILILDSSGSMVGHERIRYAKGLVRSFVKYSYQSRTYCSLIVARSQEAKVVVPPTRRSTPILEELKRLPTGGRTPLYDSLAKAIDVANAFKKKEGSAAISISLLTDGKDNSDISNLNDLVHTLRKGQITLKVFDTKAAPSSIAFARNIGAAHHLIERMSAR
jgi:Mg-chelatase subunit ChlD